MCLSIEELVRSGFAVIFGSVDILDPNAGMVEASTDVPTIMLADLSKERRVR